ncbi:MAG: calcium-binding protein [Pseudomonadota bacterium]
MTRIYELEGFGFEIIGPDNVVPDFTTSATFIGPNAGVFEYTVLGSGTDSVFFFSSLLDTITVEGAGLAGPTDVDIGFQTASVFRVGWSGGTTDVLVLGTPAGAQRHAFVFRLDGASLASIDTRAEFDNFADGLLDGEVPSTGNFIPGQPIALSEVPWSSITIGPKPDPVIQNGTEGDDRLVGDDGDDRLDGLGGNDTIIGKDGVDTLFGGTGDDEIFGGETEFDERDLIFGGDGNDLINAGHGNDEIRGQAGNDTIEGGFGVDTVIGNEGDDVLTGSAFSDLIFGGDGADFINGGFGFDRVNGGGGADRFFHIGVAGHASDWIQDFNDAEGDVLQYGASASVDDFQVNFAVTANAGTAGVAEAFIIYKPTEQILWALIDGSEQDSIMLRIGGNEFDLLA